MVAELKLADVLFALSFKLRLDMFRELVAVHRTVTELAHQFRITQPASSTHMRVLRRAGLVDFVAAGREKHYSATPLGRRLLKTIDDFADEEDIVV